MAKDHAPGAKRKVARSRGALSGVALMVLGAWGALIPFIGPYFNFSYTPDKAWQWDAARGWLEVLPGAAAFLAGFLLLTSSSRTVTLVASWIGVAAGAWFVVGLELANEWHIGSPGSPANSGSGIRILETLAMFTLLGVAIVYFAATAFGRLSVVSLRDQHAAERREEKLARENAEADAEAARARQSRRDDDDRDLRDNRDDRGDVRDDRNDLRNDRDLRDDRGSDRDRYDDRQDQGGRHEQPAADGRGVDDRQYDRSATDGRSVQQDVGRQGQQPPADGQFAPTGPGTARGTATAPPEPAKRHFWQR
ncbi:MFS transporter [uncultured Jatrophihabitans sp.]|uniref:MFS transporter n=1 Tax=uncultured Jatrophihabitans sp. TaxID=1610747 RepID=UPI0035CAB5CE